MDYLRELISLYFLYSSRTLSSFRSSNAVSHSFRKRFREVRKSVLGFGHLAKRLNIKSILNREDFLDFFDSAVAETP